MRAWIAFMGLFVLGACSNAPSTCGDGLCSAGESCGTCPGDCGSCSGSCGPASCAGCCNAGVCEGGTSPTACGGGGNACTACGSGLACIGGACVVDPASRWNVVLDALTVPSTNYAGVAWDALGGAPDPVVTVQANGGTAYSQDGPDDVFNVTYDGTPVLTNVRASDLLARLVAEVTDEDVSDYELISACTLPVSDAVFQGGAQTATCPVDAANGQSGYTLGWHLEPY